MDRDELDERIRERRSADSPFRRGSFPEDREAARRGYVPFEPDPLDQAARVEAGESAATPDHVDNTAPGFDVPPPAPPPPVFSQPEPPIVEPPMAESEPEPMAAEPEPMAAEPPARRSRKATPPPEPEVEPEPEPEPMAAEAEPEPVVAPEPEPPPAYVPPPVAALPPVAAAVPRPIAAPPPPMVSEPIYATRSPEVYPEDWANDYDDGRNDSGVSGLVVAAFIAIGVVAIGAGALLSGAFGGAATATPSPTPLVSVEPSVEATAEPSPETTPSAGEPTPSPTLLEPGVFPDGFTVEVQPCDTRPERDDGCDSSGAEVVRDIWAWVGFLKGNDSDVIGVSIRDDDGDTVGEADYALVNLDCGDSCGGWLYFRFPSLNPGDYTIVVDRNGTFAAEVGFTVTG